MASIQNLEVTVEVDISKALAALSELQDELGDLAKEIERVDKRGTEGIDINTTLDDLDTELAALKGEIEAFEKSNDIDIKTNVDHSQLGVLRGVIRDAVSDAVGSGFASGMGGGSSGSSGNDVKTMPGRLQRMQASTAPNVAELFGMMERDPNSMVRDQRGGMIKTLQRLRSQLGDTLNNLTDFNLRMSDIHNAMAALIPVLIVFIGAIPAAYTALMTLAGAAFSAAAAFAAMGGLGALGLAMEDGQFNMDNLTEAWEDIRDDFLDAFAPLAERLQPLFEDGLDGLERFFQAVANEGDALMALTDEARSFGRFLTEFVPDALRTLAGLVEAMGPVFGNIGDSVQNGFNDVVRTFIEITMEALPALVGLGQQIASVLPALVRMSVGFARVAAVVIQVIGVIGKMFSYLGMTSEQLGMLTAGLLAFVSAVALANSAVLTYAATAIGGAIKAMWSWFYVTMFQSTALGSTLIPTLASAIVSVYGYITSMLGATGASMSMATATMIAAGALAAFLTLASLGVLAGLATVAMGVASNFLGMADSIDSATSSLKEFNRVSGASSGSGDNPYDSSPYGDDGGDPPKFGGGGGPSGGATINIESSGDRESDKSSANKGFWRLGRTSGGGR